LRLNHRDDDGHELREIAVAEKKGGRNPENYHRSPGQRSKKLARVKTNQQLFIPSSCPTRKKSSLPRSIQQNDRVTDRGVFQFSRVRIDLSSARTNFGYRREKK